MADRIGAEICGQPGWLASALVKLHAGTQQIHNTAAERNLLPFGVDRAADPVESLITDGLEKTQARFNS